MPITRIISDVPKEQVGFVLAAIRSDGGTARQETEPDDQVTIIATFPDPPAPSGAPTPARPARPSAAAKELPWMAVARDEMGQTEVDGEGSNPRIVEYHATTRGGAETDSVPWCSSFVNFCVEQIGLKGTDSKRARSWMTWGKEAPDFIPGCIVVLKRGTASQGHVGFFVGTESGHIRVLGGNQGNTVSVASFPIDRVVARRVPDTA